MRLGDWVLARTIYDISMLIKRGFLKEQDRNSIDDFGTGYSSLYYLASLPVDMLKIDAIFIARMLEHKKYDQVVQAIIQLGHNLGFKVVAEGVENEQQAQKLIQYGCDQLQGFWLAKPESFGNLALHWQKESTAMSSQIKLKKLPLSQLTVEF